jgi:hypothetical protein
VQHFFILLLLGLYDLNVFKIAKYILSLSDVRENN